MTEEPHIPFRRDPRLEQNRRRASAEGIPDKEEAKPTVAKRRDPRLERSSRRAGLSDEPQNVPEHTSSPDQGSGGGRVTSKHAATPASSEAQSPATDARQLRRDPRRDRGRERHSTSSETSALRPDTDPEIRKIDDASFWVLVVPDAISGALSSHDQDTIAVARLIADNHEGGVIALAPEGAADYGRMGIDRLAPFPSTNSDAELRLSITSHILDALGPKHVVLPESAYGAHLARLLSVRRGLPIATGVTRISEAGWARPTDGGRREQIVAPTPIVTIAPEAAELKLGPAREARRIALPAFPPLESELEDCGLLPLDPQSVPLQEAEFIVSAGTGVSDWTTFEDLARVIGAAIGCTRAVCDAGHLPRHRQIGASGTLVNPRCYLSFGISGAPQHLQGIARCERVIAVNTDLHADMIKRADLAIVADAQVVMRSLVDLLRPAR